MPTPLPPSAQQNGEIAREIYDRIMAEIEPDLLLSTIPLLDTKYAGETTVQHEERMKRYAVAYKKFEEAFAAFKLNVNGSIHTAKTQALQEEEQQSVAADRAKLDAIAGEF